MLGKESGKHVDCQGEIREKSMVEFWQTPWIVFLYQSIEVYSIKSF